MADTKKESGPLLVPNNVSDLDSAAADVGLVPVKYDVLQEIGTTGLRRFGNNVYEEFLPQLQGMQAIRVYRQMSENDGTVGSLLFAIDMLIRQVSWRVEPASSDATDVQYAEFLSQCLEDLSHPFSDSISEALTMLIYGWSYLETVYKRRQGFQDEDSDIPTSLYDDGKIGWKKFAGRSQDSFQGWVFDKNNNVQALIQQAPPDYQTRVIPIRKSLLFRTKINKNNPEGISALRSAYRSWYFKCRMEEIEGIGVERDLAGLPTAFVDPKILRNDADDADKQLLKYIKTLVTNVKRDTNEGIIFPSVYDDHGNPIYDFKLMSAPGDRQFDVGAIIQRYSETIAMTVMADFIFLGHQAVGSFALSNGKQSMFSQALGGWMDGIQNVFNRYAVPRLFALNGMADRELPKIMHGDIETTDLDVLGTFLKTMNDLGMHTFPDDQFESYIRDVAGLPAKSGEARTLEQKDATRSEALKDAGLKQAEAEADYAVADAKAAEEGLKQQKAGKEQVPVVAAATPTGTPAPKVPVGKPAAAKVAQVPIKAKVPRTKAPPVKNTTAAKRNAAKPPAAK